jgi:DNA-binding GntR family transcriptional regulator
MTNEGQLPSDLFMDLDRSGPMPLYFQVASRIEESIRSGAMPPGARLENEIALGERLGLSRPTIRRAIQDLVDKGLLVRRRGIGTQVVHGPVTRKVELTSLYDDLAQGAQAPATKLLQRNDVPAPDDVAAALSVAPGTTVAHIRRVRFAEDVPMAILENYLPPEFLDLTDEDLQAYGCTSCCAAGASRCGWRSSGSGPVRSPTKRPACSRSRTATRCSR